MIQTGFTVVVIESVVHFQCVQQDRFAPDGPLFLRDPGMLAGLVVFTVDGCLKVIFRSRSAGGGVCFVSFHLVLTERFVSASSLNISNHGTSFLESW